MLNEIPKAHPKGTFKIFFAFIFNKVQNKEVEKYCRQKKRNLKNWFQKHENFIFINRENWTRKSFKQKEKRFSVVLEWERNNQRVKQIKNYERT